MRLAGLSLRNRIGLVLTGLAASLLLVLAGLWMQGTRAGIHEEVVAATRVSEQWLRALMLELDAETLTGRSERLLQLLRPMGRVRANIIEVYTADGVRQYQSPPSAYKAGRTAPDWFAPLVTPAFRPTTLMAGGLMIQIIPDPSRAVLDAWDEINALAGWALLLLLALFLTTRFALGKALRPLDQVMGALNETGQGRFDTRLPAFATPDLNRLSRAFNGMADRLGAAVDDNVRLETERELARQIQASLEAERRAISRELHDELAQGITAVRALAGAIVQRCDDNPSLRVPAQCIVTTTGEMQQGVSAILQRLRLVDAPLQDMLEKLVANWQQQHPAIRLEASLACGDVTTDTPVGQVVLRLIQEGLTNVVRHADAARVCLSVIAEAGALRVQLADDGRGAGGVGLSKNAGSGFGLAGMRERVAMLGGELTLESPPTGGFVIAAHLPETPAKALST